MRSRPAVDRDDVGHCIALVRERAMDSYLADLLLPEKARAGAFVLHAFHVEIGRIALATQEPLAGEMRLQWWREVLSRDRDGEALGHPIARSLLALTAGLPELSAALEAKLDAHVFDLYRDPMEDRTMLEGWCGATHSILFQLIARLCDAQPGRALADASGHAGCAAAMCEILENMGRHRSRGQVYVPADLLSRAQLNAGTFLEAPDGRHETAVLELVGLARDHLQQAKRAVQDVEPQARGAFRSLALNTLIMKRVEKFPAEVFSRLRPVSQLRRQWALWRGV